MSGANIQKIVKRKKKILQNKPAGIPVSDFLEMLYRQQKIADPLYTVEDIMELMRERNPNCTRSSAAVMLKYLKELSTLDGYGGDWSVIMEKRGLWETIEKYCKYCSQPRTECYRNARCPEGKLPPSLLKKYREKMVCSEGRNTAVYKITVRKLEDAGTT